MEAEGTNHGSYELRKRRDHPIRRLQRRGPRALDLLARYRPRDLAADGSESRTSGEVPTRSREREASYPSERQRSLKPASDDREVDEYGIPVNWNDFTAAEKLVAIAALIVTGVITGSLFLAPFGAYGTGLF